MGSGSSQEDLSENITSLNKDAILDFNQAMSKLSLHTEKEKPDPLTFQLSTSWEDSKKEDKEACMQKANEACGIICNVIAPKDGEKLFQAIQQPLQAADNAGPSDDLVALMSAYRDASNKNLKTQILSIYAYRYTMKEILTFHEPYERISLRQIKQARAHARKLGPGSSVPKVVNHRVRLDTNKVDHFVEFINRPYFYQDVAFGTRTLTVEGGREVTMPNVIRTVTRSTMVMQYLQYCKEQNFDPVSRSTMYRILEVREASQQKSLCGIDNTAAEGVTSFERLSNILDELIQVGGDKKNLNDLKTKLSEGKKYLKTEYKMNCSSEESECADHCRRFALSDSDNPNFKAACSHKHTRVCSKCEQLKTTLNEIEKTIKSHASNLYSKEQRDDLLHDFKTSENGILSWKCHIIRSVNQESAKQDVLRDLDCESALIVADWAMKFLQLRYRERQSEWYGKRGLSWHISSVVTRDKETKQIKVLSYAHLFDSCSQDWYAVTSTIETSSLTSRRNSQT